MLKKSVLIILSTIAIGMICFGSYQLYLAHAEYIEEKAIETNSAIDLSLKEGEIVPAEEFKNGIKEKASEISNQNEDFIGWIKFNSNLINLPVVQGDDNEYYLKNNIEKKESKYGCTFMDAYQSLESRNITLYGHHIYNDSSVCFSPLMSLYEPSNYRSNKYLSFVLKTGEVLKYEVISVVEYNGIDKPYFAQSYLNDHDWQAYIDYINNQKLYETGITASVSDKILCFQTCIKHNDPRRFLVFARLM